jgi:hypothetical protein
MTFIPIIKEMYGPEVIYCTRGPINSTYKNFKSRENYFYYQINYPPPKQFSLEL